MGPHLGGGTFLSFRVKQSKTSHTFGNWNWCCGWDSVLEGLTLPPPNSLSFSYSRAALTPALCRGLGDSGLPEVVSNQNAECCEEWARAPFMTPVEVSNSQSEREWKRKMESRAGISTLHHQRLHSEQSKLSVQPTVNTAKLLIQVSSWWLSQSSQY